MAIQTRQGRKGLLSIAVLLLSLSFLFLSASISSYSNSLHHVNVAALNPHSAAMQSDSVSSSFRVLLSGCGTVASFSANSSNLTITYDSTLASSYPLHAQRLSSFLEANSRPGNLTLDIPESAFPALNVRPYNISVGMASRNLSFLPQNSAESAGRVLSYHLSLWVPLPNTSLGWSSLQSVPSSDPNALYLHIGAQGADNASGIGEYVDRTKTSIATVYSLGEAVLNVTFSDQAALSATSISDFSASLEAGLNTTGVFESPQVELGENIIYVRLVDGTERRGRAVVGN